VTKILYFFKNIFSKKKLSPEPKHQVLADVVEMLRISHIRTEMGGNKGIHNI